MIIWCPTFINVLRMPDVVRDSKISQDEFRAMSKKREDAETSSCRLFTQVACMGKMAFGGYSFIKKFLVFFRVEWMSEMKNFWNIPLSLRCRRNIDAGVWNGQSYDDVPATTIVM